MRQPATWRAEVFALAGVCAVCATMADGYLLDRKLGIFSGGYLAEFQLRGLRWVVFVLLSLLSDLAILAPIVAAVLWLSRWLWMHAVARAFLAVAVALGVSAIADIAIYELQRYLGDLVNAGVLIDLIGGDVREILHFGASPALHWLGMICVGALLVVGASVGLDRWFPSRMRQDPGARRRTFVALIGVLVLALVCGAVARVNDRAIGRAFSYKPSGRVLGMLTQVLTDVDRDGFGLLSVPADPDAFDGGIHPFATDMPGNGIDENGVAGDLPVGEDFRDSTWAPVTFTHRPDVVFVILETFRADVIGATLNGREVTPNLNRLAREGVSATRAFSHNGFTVQSRYHAFTGALLGPGNPGSLIDDFNANGYQTAFFSAQDESFGHDYDVGFERAAVRYDARDDRDKRFTQFSTPSSLTVSWKVLEARVNAFLAERSPDVPLFLHLNIQDGHFPYTNPDVETLLDDARLERHDIRPEQADVLRRMYLNTLANVDAALGRMLAQVEKRTGRRPGVFVIADHGESLFDEGFLGHGYAANDAQTRIPFIVDHLPAVVPDPVGQIDVRQILRDALTTATPSAPPTRVADPERRVFQYIGLLEAPKSIAEAGPIDRQVVSLADGDVGEDPSRIALVHRWERIQRALRGER